MSNAGFLLIAVAGIIAGSLAVWAVNRKPKTFMSSIDDFSREMKALGHDTDEAHGRRRRRTAPPSGRRSRPTAIDPGLTHPPTPTARRDGAPGTAGAPGATGAAGPAAADPEERRP